MMRWTVSLVVAGVLTGSASSTGCASNLTDMPGRWLLHEAGRASCVLSFSGASYIPHGKVAAMGFCPQRFFGLPRWRLDAGRVVHISRRGRTVADLVAGPPVDLTVGRDRLYGQTATGEAFFLER